MTLIEGVLNALHGRLIALTSPSVSTLGGILRRFGERSSIKRLLRSRYGELDITPWSALLDEIAFVGNDPPPPDGTGPYTYSCVQAGPFGDDAFGVPNHVLRCTPDDIWEIDQEEGLQDDTVGEPNTDCLDLACPWDFNKNGEVDPGDLAILLGCWGECPDDLCAFCSAIDPLDP